MLTPVLYDPAAPAGQRWSSDGFSASTVPRMYHSSALLLADGLPIFYLHLALHLRTTLLGSIFVSGSNPNKDYSTGPDVKYPTEYRTERFFPPYYNQRRPQPKGLLSQFSYGGPIFDVTLDSDDLFGDIKNIENASVVVLRPGFSTHAMVRHLTFFLILNCL